MPKLHTPFNPINPHKNPVNPKLQNSTALTNISLPFFGYLHGFLPGQVCQSLQSAFQARRGKGGKASIFGLSVQGAALGFQFLGFQGAGWCGVSVRFRRAFLCDTFPATAQVPFVTLNVYISHLDAPVTAPLHTDRFDSFIMQTEVLGKADQRNC